MSGVIKSLKAEHAHIGKVLEKVHDYGIHSDEGRKALLAAKKELLAHLKHEDENLYPTLLKEAKSDPILADALDFFNEDIPHVASVALEFFEKYETGGADEDFSEDFSNVVHVLTQRIKKEESVIYKLFNQLEM